MERTLRSEPAPPDRFAAYVKLLEETVARTLANARDARRLQRYRPVAAVSRGYDSPAVAVLAARAGVREAVTFADVKGVGDGDDGSAIATRLGYEVSVYPHRAYQGLAGMPRRRRFATGASARLTPRWRGSSRVRCCSPAATATSCGAPARCSLTRATRPPRTRVAARCASSTCGTAVHFPVPYILSRDPRPLRRISLSTEMRPWSVGGDYDRPIPRRIAEEAGIPCEGFGRRKENASDPPFRRRSERASQRELRAFVDALPRDRTRAWTHRIMRRAYALDLWATAWAERALNRLGADVLLAPSVHPRWKRSLHPEFWAFHWGFAQLRDRYAVAPATPEPRLTSSSRASP
jgi:hypothetical protein